MDIDQDFQQPGSGQPPFTRTSTWRWTLGVETALAFGLTFLLRWLTVDFTNDHFTHLSRARQIVMGEWPIRDFFDPGQFLHYYVSAAAQVVFGFNLFGEALVTIGFIAVAAALTFALASRLSGSNTIAAAATVAAVTAFPRLYNYPKIFLYVAVLWVAWWYARQPTRRRIGALAAFSVLAFLFRYDHGVYIAGFIVVLLTLVHVDRPRQWGRAVGRFAGLFILCLIPFALYVQWAQGIKDYVMANGSSARNVSSAAMRTNTVAFAIDRSAPWLVVHPFANARVLIRWKESVNEPARRRLEDRYGLIDPVPHGEAWNYGLTDIGPRNVRALLDDGQLADGFGLSVESLEPSTLEKLWQPINRVVPLSRTTVAPGFFTATNALAWFYGATFVIPILALLMSLAAWWRGRIGRAEAATIAAAACLCMVIDRTLMSSDPEARLADVVTPTAVLGAWIAGRWLTIPSDRSARRGERVVRRLALTMVFAVTFWSIAVQSGIGTILRTFHVVGGPIATWQRVVAMDHRLHLRPIDDWAPEGRAVGIKALARYAMRCTTPDDRLLVINDFAPEFFFYTERRFAGGHVHFMAAWHTSLADQKRTIELLRHQSVPIVIEGLYDRWFDQPFLHVAEYIRARYVEAAHSSFGGPGVWSVLVDRQRAQVGTDPELGLPCYRRPPVED